MTARHYRLCFDPHQRELFTSADQFNAWCGENLTFEHRPAGYIVLNWADVESRRVGPHWNAIVPGLDTAGVEQPVIQYLTENDWKVAGVTVIAYVKNGDDNEKLVLRPA